MHTPTKQQFQHVIDTLKSVLPMAQAEENFDMGQGFTFDCDGSLCGTVHCIGGWYAVAKKLNLEKPGEVVTYTHGAAQMAMDLGFEMVSELEQWAIDNSDLWGNAWGASMFCDIEAYNRAESLAEAIAHLEKVRDRLPE